MCIGTEKLRNIEETIHIGQLILLKNGTQREINEGFQ